VPNRVNPSQQRHHRHGHLYVLTETILTVKPTMRTVKLVVIGNSGVGKTSLRDQVCKAECFLNLFANLATNQLSMSLVGSQQDIAQQSVRISSQRRCPITPTPKNPSLSKSGSVSTRLASSWLTRLNDRIPLVKNASPHSPLPSFAVQMPPFSCSTSIGPQRSMP
jgi:hypothetical protein